MMEKMLSPFQPLKSDTKLRDYFAIFVRRKLLILVAFVSVAGSIFMYVSRIKDVYESFSTIVIEEKNIGINQAMNTLTPSRSLDFYQGILESRTFLEMAVDSIGLEVLKTANPKMTREMAINEIQSAFNLKSTEYASFMRLNARASTKDLAYCIASVGTAVFRKRCQEVETEESRATMQEIDKQIKMVHDKLEKAERDYQTFKERTGNILDGMTPELKTLQDTFATNLAQLGIKDASLGAEKKQLANMETSITPAEQERSPEFLKLRSRLRELEQEKLRLENLGIRMVGTSTVDREIQDIEGQLLQYRKSKQSAVVDPRLVKQWQEARKSVLTKESELDLFKKRLDSYKKAIGNYKTRNPDILAQSLELLRLQRSSQVYQNVYNVLLEKVEEERMKSASNSAGIKIVDVARQPENPIPKNETRYYIVGVIMGLLLGLGLALFIEYNDTTIKSNEDIERYLGVSVLGTIPHIAHNKKSDIQIRRRSAQSKNATSVVQYPRQILNFAGDDSVITESYRSLRTNLSFVSPDHPLHAVIVTSAGPGEGKSLTTVNCATAYAQMGKKTLLVDTDLRRPVVHHFFDMRREPGFSDLFGENLDYSAVIRPSGKENLDVITAGIFTPNPAELIGSHKMTQHIEYFKKNYEMIFFDTPPIVAVTDATLLGKKVDGVLLVIKSHHSDREFVSRALMTLNNVGVKVWGAILNDIDLTHRYSSYGYYKYYYHYYKSKKD
jgi:capsular exopolysaccharide synthesis family protein